MELGTIIAKNMTAKNAHDWAVPWNCAGFLAVFAQNRYQVHRLLWRFWSKMASVRRELMMLRVFRLTLPAALLVSLTWMTLFTDSARQAVLNSLGANANVIIFILGLFVVVGLYWLMGVYERKITYENRHVRPAF